MSENGYEKKGSSKSLYVIIICAVVLVVLLLIPEFMLFFRSDATKNEQDVNTEKAETRQADGFSVSEEEWSALQSKVAQLESEVLALKSAQAGMTKSVKSSNEKSMVSTSAAASSNKPASQSLSTAVTLASYNHDWSSREATVALKNNTDRTVTSVSGRIIYYDMKGNMLDYRDFTQSVNIEPGMAKTFSMSGYGTKDFYAYYKSDSFDSHHRYNVKFELKSFNAK